MSTIETPWGPVPVWGRMEGRERLLFVVRGAGADADQLEGLVEAFPDVDVALVHLPGFHSPAFETASLQAFGGAFDAVLAALGHPAVVALGASIGGTTTLAMRSPSIRRRVLLDSPLQTGALKPLQDRVRPSAWYRDVMGFTEGGIENRDYRGLLDQLRAPAIVLIGGDAPADRLPSLVSEADRAVYFAKRGIRSLTIPGVGHNIPTDATSTMLRAVRYSLRHL